ncbi:glycerol kinase GlpK [Furfurilactobacillus sp. WILCCON 0119]
MAFITEHYILAVDQGTTASRAIIINQHGRRVTAASQPLPQINRHPGWVEHDPNLLWNSVQSAISTVLINTGIHPDQIAGVGIVTQRETTIIWDKTTGEPIAPAIGWQSQQVDERTPQLIKDGYNDLIHKKTGLFINPYFSAAKIRWLLDHVPGAQARAERGELCFGTVDSWLAWKLSGAALHVTDYSNASRTMLFNIHTLDWDDEILHLMNIPRALLPTVKSSAEVYGHTQNYQFFGAEVPIAALAGDQQAALFGQMGFEKGVVKNTYGAGAFIIMNTGTTPLISTNGLLTTIAYGANGTVKYALEGSIFVAGSAISWLQDEMHMIPDEPAAKRAALASTNDDEVYLVPAFSGLGAPYWDDQARGAVYGITRGTTQNDFVKATLQAIAYQTRDIIETMKKDTQLTIPQLNADGASSRNTYLMQFQADILNMNVNRSADEETTALGAAYLAGLAVGFWDNVDALKAIYQPGKTFSPTMSAERRHHLYHGWQMAVKATELFK